MVETIIAVSDRERIVLLFEIISASVGSSNIFYVTSYSYVSKLLASTTNDLSFVSFISQDDPLCFCCHCFWNWLLSAIDGHLFPFYCYSMPLSSGSNCTSVPLYIYCIVEEKGE